MTELRYGPGRGNIRNLSADFSKLVLRRAQERAAEDIRRVVGREVDRTMHAAFQYMANQMRGGTNFQAAAFTKYLPYPWKPLNKRYTQEKGNKKFFYKTGDLASELRGITLNEAVAHLGATRVSIARNGKRIDVEIVPDARIVKVGFEQQLSGMLDEATLDKLENRRDNYRALFGPVFEYFARERVPTAIRKAIGGIR